MQTVGRPLDNKSVEANVYIHIYICTCILTKKYSPTIVNTAVASNRKVKATKDLALCKYTT